MKKFAIGLSSKNEIKKIQTERHIREYENVKNILKFEWHITYMTQDAIKEILSGVYQNATRELLGLPTIELEVVYRRTSYNICTLEDTNILKGFYNKERLAQQAINLRKELEWFIKFYNITDEDLMFIETSEFKDMCRAYDISPGVTIYDVEKNNISHVRDWDYHTRRDAGVEDSIYNDLVFTYEDSMRTKEVRETLTIDKLKALLSLRYYIQYMPVPVRIITDGFHFAELKATDMLPDGWKYTPLSVGEMPKDTIVFPVSASAGRCRKITGDPCTNPEDFMF